MASPEGLAEALDVIQTGKVSRIVRREPHVFRFTCKLDPEQMWNGGQRQGPLRFPFFHDLARAVM